jgi:hypothetical protein
MKGKQMWFWKNKSDAVRAEFIWGPIDGHVELLLQTELQDQVIVVIERVALDQPLPYAGEEEGFHVTAAQYALRPAKDGVRYCFVRVVPLEKLLEWGLGNDPSLDPNHQFVRWPHEENGQ